jgi:protein-S-isoprenylcysteine O-methyltransferase Ste14
MEKLFIFLVLSLPIIIVSWRTLFNIRSHGFYRFFAWEGILWLLVSNYELWFTNPFSINQIFSWIFLFYSIYPALAGAILLKKHGNSKEVRKEDTLYKFEKTTELVTSGIFKHIRHPLYSSLILLTWGIYLKNPADLTLLIIAIISTIFLYFTAKFDEIECIAYFGNDYVDYMKRSKMFIPFIF